METYLPYIDFTESVKCLDNRTLLKQSQDASIIYHILLEGVTNSMHSYPEVQMWLGYKEALAIYHNICIGVCRLRAIHNPYREITTPADIKWKMPYWIGMDELHDSHRATLLNLYPEWYSLYNWNVDEDTQMYYPPPFHKLPKEMQENEE